MGIPEDRLEALSLGLKYYHGKECIRCGSTIKRVRQYDCLECHKAAVRKYHRTPMGRALKSTNRRLRKVDQRQAQVPWADMKKIAKIYQDAKEQGMHVDHIIPLKHPLVCGLHCEFNLQLLTPEANMAKRNYFEIS